MKLRNKKTGEMKEWTLPEWLRYITNPDNKENYECSLTEFIDRTTKFRDNWEDYEEPKKFYIVEQRGIVDSRFRTGDGYEEMFKEIGNYFETREEAEKAVEKIKAWRRLKDAGFRFECYTLRSDWAGLPEAEALENLIDITAYLPKDKIKERKADLELLFGGKE